MTDDTPIALPPVSKGLIGDTLVQTVNARDVHNALGIRRDFSTWIRERIETYNFLENQDFVCSPVSGSKGQGGHNRLDYFLTLDMGKELAMVERSDKGRMTRRHFIECERRLREVEPLESSPTGHDASPRQVHIAFRSFHAIGKIAGLAGNEATLAANRATVKRTGVDALSELGITHIVAAVQQELLTPTEVGKRLGDLSGQSVNKLLEARGFQELGQGLRGRRPWHPTEKGQPFGKWLDTSKAHNDGTSVLQWKWFASIVDELRGPPPVEIVATSFSASAG